VVVPVVTPAEVENGPRTCLRGTLENTGHGITLNPVWANVTAHQQSAAARPIAVIAFRPIG
jgi:hypothetical protein